MEEKQSRCYLDILREELVPALGCTEPIALAYAVSNTITNTIANMGGVVCDGAKSSCAVKIASAVGAAIMAYTLEKEDHCFQPGEGLVKENVEDTNKSMGYVGRVGMKDTDVTILNLMIDGEGVK